MADTLREWLKSGKYLPPILRDFHDQKDVFKAIHHTIRVEERDYDVNKINWVMGQIYVIDIFLWWMAKRGYTLQRNRRRLEFESLEGTVEQCRKERNAAFAATLQQKGQHERPD